MKTTNTIKVKSLPLITAIGLVGVITGCTTPSGRPDHTANGALIGGASGAAIGALADRRAPGAGALIGGAAGLVAGGLVGHTMDRQAEANAQSAPPIAAPPVVVTAPPPPPPEAVVAVPGPGYVWVSGEWVWEGGTWVWVGGHWVLPPYQHAIWVAPHWVRGPHGWLRVEGYWR
jgi:YMGG-like Gly-zipper/WXXGXW repeat (2 copies)